MKLEYLGRGKVREQYQIVGDDHDLVLVATDRISAFDVVFAEPVPDKGRLLTAISSTFFEQIGLIIPTHYRGSILSEDPLLGGRSVRVARAQMLPVECVVRGYLVGSAWREYEVNGTINGSRVESGLHFGERLATPLFTPTTKAISGHDQPLTRQGLQELVGAARAVELYEAAQAVYEAGAAIMRSVGLTLIDSKFEFGIIGGELTLCDEIFTPDSSRIVLGDPDEGERLQWLDKQILRDWLQEQGFRGEGAVPILPVPLLADIRSSYQRVFELISGTSFSKWPGSKGLCYVGREVG
ncbi:MAG: phosphoribosylaminoimidazolesuccinocarboxamide synthase [Ferrimicrobium sp.]